MSKKKKAKKAGSLKRFQIRTSKKNLSSNAGLAVIQRFWQQLGGEAWLNRELGFLKADNSVYSLGRIITILLLSVIQGAKRISHTARLARDNGLRKLWDWVNFPVETTIIRTLNLFRQAQVIKFADMNQNLRQKVWDRKWFGKITLDLDSTAKTVYGHQQGAELGYNPHNKGKKCLNPIIATIFQTKEVVLGWLRPGNTFSANGSVEFLKETLARLPKQIWKIVVRADSAFFSNAFLLLLESLGLQYVIKAKFKGWERWLLGQAQWRFSGPERWTTQFAAKLPGWQKERTFMAVKVFKEWGDGGFLGPFPIYEYQLWVTDLRLSPNKLEDFYNQRVTCENIIDQGKNQTGWGGMLTQNFWTNDLLFQIALLAYNLMVWFKLRFLPEGEQTQEIETFRQRIIYTAGQIVFTGNQWYLDLGANNPEQEWWLQVGDRQLSVQPF